MANSMDVPSPTMRVDCWGEICFLEGKLRFKAQCDMEEHFGFTHCQPAGNRKKLGQKILSLLI